MIVKGLVRVRLEQNVQAMVLNDVKLPIMTALKSDLGSMERAELQIDLMNSPINYSIKMESWLPLRLDTLSATDFGKPGLLVGKTNAGALEYLVEHWVPGSVQSVDLAVAAARQAKANGMPFMGCLEGFTASEERLQLSRWGADPGTVDDYVWDQKLFFAHFECVHADHRDVFVINSNRIGPDSMSAIVAPCNRSAGKIRIRGWDMLTCAGNEGNRHVVASSPEGWQAGRLGRMDPGLLDWFDRKGRYVAISQTDLTAWQNWVAPILVKVPRASDRTGDSSDPDWLTGFPVAKLVDARLPIEFTPDVTVVEDPSRALDILCRSSRGYVIADIGGGILPTPFRKMAGRWLAVCVPRQWVYPAGSPARAA